LFQLETIYKSRKLKRKRLAEWQAFKIGGAGGIWTRVQKMSTFGTTCLVCHLFNCLELRQTGFPCSWPDTISRFTLRQGSLAILLGWPSESPL